MSDDAWRDLGEAPPNTPVIAQYRAWNKPDGDLMEHVVWFYDRDWRLYPQTIGTAFADRWRPMSLATATAQPVEGGEVWRLRQIVQVVAEADSEDCIGSLDVDIPKGGFPRQWLRDAARAALARQDTPAGMVENWQTINQWCDDTFGLATVPQIIARAKEEFVELESPDADHVIEAADVVICLCRIPGFADALQRKMAINRKRKWRLTGDGTGYHIPDAAMIATSDAKEAG